MIKVLLTTDHCTPPLTRTIECDDVKIQKPYYVKMYDNKHKLIAWAFIDEWQSIAIEYDNGIRQVIK